MITFFSLNNGCLLGKPRQQELKRLYSVTCSSFFSPVSLSFHFHSHYHPTPYHQIYHHSGGGGHWPKKGVWGCAALKTPLFTPLLPLARVPFQAKESVHKTPFWENLEILASAASIFTQILAHKPQNLEIFSSQAPKFGNFPLTSPPFSDANVSSQPHTSEIRAAHPYLKKSWVPPGHHSESLHNQHDYKCFRSYRMTLHGRQYTSPLYPLQSRHIYEPPIPGGGYSHIKTYGDVPQKWFGFLFLFLFCFVLFCFVFPSKP